MRKFLLSDRVANVYFIAIATLGICLSLLVFNQIVAADKDKIDTASFSQANVIANELQQIFQNRYVQVASVVNLFATSDWVSYQEFNKLIKLVYINEHDYRRLSWIVRTEQKSIPLLLDKLRKNSEPEFKNFNFFSLVNEQIVAPQYVNGEIWAVAYPYPLSLENKILGRALGQHSPIFSLLDSTLQAGKSKFSPIMLDLVPSGDKAKAMYLIASPIDLSDSAFGKGFITSGNFLKEHFDLLLKNSSSSGFTYVLQDHQQHFYAYPSDQVLTALPDTTPHSYSLDINVNDQIWTLYFYNSNLQQYKIGMVYKLFLILGILLSFGIGFITRMQLLQKSKLKLQVEKQTKELNSMIDKLTVNNEQLNIAVEGAQASAVAKQQFMANMSHEIRTPINGIIGMTELCRKTELSPKQSEYLAKIKLSANHLATIINDILDYAKVNSGSVVLEERPFSLLSIFDNLHAMLNKEAEDKNILFKVSLPADVPADVIGDKVRLSQILLNLCANAIKFTEHGEVLLKVSADKKSTNSPLSFYRFNFMVIDTGIGIAPENLPFLFDNFTQADSSTTRRYGGTGLGLTISQQLCHLMGGQISVTSELGKGSTFVAEIDLQLNTAILISDDKEYKFSYIPKVLLLDDNINTLRLIASELSDMGAEVRCFQRAEPALNCLLTESMNFDFVLLDWVLPECNGQEFLTRLKQASLSFPPRIVVITSYDVDSVNQESQALSIEKIMTKPCHRVDLFNVLEHKKNQAITNAPLHLLAGLTILVAEDNDINREIIDEILRYYGATVLLSVNGQNCIDLLHQNHLVDLILMDIQMPVMDGVTAFKLIRNEAVYSKLPIVALTANVLSEDKQEYIKLGMNGHLAKPFESDKIIACILALTQHKTA